MDATDNRLEVTTAAYSIPAENFLTLSEKVAKLARKATKLGVSNITLAKTGEKDIPFLRSQVREEEPRYRKLETPDDLVKAQQAIRWDEERHGASFSSIVYRKFFDVTLTGAIPRLAGYEFVATLQHLEVDGEVANMLRIVPGFKDSLPVRFRTSGPENCDHCRKVIRSRKETFVVRKAGTDEWLQVGRNCTQDFLGGVDPHAVAKMLEYLQSAGDLCSSAEGEGFGGGHFEPAGEMEEFLAWAAACVRIDGWVSRGKARASDGALEATANTAFSFMCPPTFGPGASVARRKFEQARREHTPTDADKDLAARALEYAETSLKGKIEGNDYLYNLWVACNQSLVTYKLAGIAGSLISHFVKEVERQTLNEAELRRAKDSQFVGELGERRFFNVQVLKVITLESQWGTSCLHKMVDQQGNSIVWFNTAVENLETGKTYWIKATVKKHEDRPVSKDSTVATIKQTVVNRAEVVTEEEVKAAEEKAAKKAARAAKKAGK